MNIRFFWLTVVAVITSFVGGFLFANALNRNEMSSIQAENARLKTAQTSSQQNTDELALSSEEITKKIKEADDNAENIQFQKNLGMALYNYASMKQDTDLMNDIIRLLNRAFESNPKDSEVVLSLGNLYFDIGYLKKENEKLIKAREYYQKTLQLKPEDPNVLTDLGLTYFLINPPETTKAINLFQQSLAIDPKHEKTLQVLTRAQISQNQEAEAIQNYYKLAEVNPENQYLTEFKEQLKIK